MDSSSTPQPELLVAVQGGISYKSTGSCVLSANLRGAVKKPYEKPTFRVYGDIRTMTQATFSKAKNSDGKTFFGIRLKTH
jgi:hypothetical protein